MAQSLKDTVQEYITEELVNPALYGGEIPRFDSIFDSADEDPLPPSSTQLAPPVQPPPPGDSISQDKALEDFISALPVNVTDSLFNEKPPEYLE